MIEKSYTEEEIAEVVRKHGLPRYPKIALYREKLSRKAKAGGSSLVVGRGMSVILLTKNPYFDRIFPYFLEAFDMTTAIIGERGQITIPKQYRTKLGLLPSMVLTFRISGNALVAEKQKPSNPFEAYRGCLRFPEGVHCTDELVREMRGC